jgi:diguanylate cyclase (GGDEF)-like protein
MKLAKVAIEEREALIFIARDISERKRIEEKLIKSNEELELRVKERTQELANSYQELQLRDSQQALLIRMEEFLHRCTTLEEAIPIIANTLESMFETFNGFWSVPGPNQNETWTTIKEWGSRKEWKEIWHPEMNGQRETLSSNFETSSNEIFISLVIHGENFGIIRIHSEHAISSSIRQIAQTSTEIIKLSLFDLKLNASLREQAMVDPLTGLYNRRYLNDTLARELDIAVRNQSKLSLALLDIDHFKRFNDGYGHPAGDLVLKVIAQKLKRNLRKSDIACRYGGEEFMLILLNSGLKDAQERVHLICQNIRSERIHYSGKLFPALTLSGGLACYPEHGSSLEDLIECADKALYQSKQTGRDRITVLD